MHPKAFVNNLACSVFYVDLLPQTCVDSSLQPAERSQHTETNHHITGDDTCHSNGVCDVADDRDSSVHAGRTTSDKDDCERSIRGNRHGRMGKIVSCVYSKSVKCPDNKELLPDFSLGRAERQADCKCEAPQTGLILHHQKEESSVCQRACSQKTDKVKKSIRSRVLLGRLNIIYCLTLLKSTFT